MLPPYLPLWLPLGLLGVIASGLVFAWVPSSFLRSKVGEIGGYVASGVASCIVVVRVVAACRCRPLNESHRPSISGRCSRSSTLLTGVS